MDDLSFEQFKALPDETQKYILYQGQRENAHRMDGIIKIFWTIITGFILGTIGFMFMVLEVLGRGAP